MRLEGIHHITCITADARRNVDFYARADGPADGQEDRQPGRADRLPPLLRGRAGQPRLGPDLLRVPGAAPGRAGDGMVHRIGWRVASTDALDFWAKRLGGDGLRDRARRRPAAVPRLRGPRARARGRRHAGRAADRQPSRGPARARPAGLRRRARLQLDPERSRPLLEEALSFEPRGDGWEARGERRGSSTPTTSRPRSAGSRARAPCITSPGPRTTKTTSSGASG